MSERSFDGPSLQDVIADMPTPTDAAGTLALFAALTVADGEARGASVEEVKADWANFLDEVKAQKQPQTD